MDEKKLRQMRAPLEEALQEYEHLTGLEFQDFEDMKLTPEKPNSARTIAPVTDRNNHIGDLYIIAFQPGDGTGDTSTYRLEDVMIDPNLLHRHMPERVIPRAKTGIITEGYFPLCSETEYGNILLFRGCLWELGIMFDKVITKNMTLGDREIDFISSVSDNRSGKPHVHKTVGTKNGRRFGDPHAIYNPRQLPRVIQYAGFLALRTEETAKLAESWDIPDYLP